METGTAPRLLLQSPSFCYLDSQYVSRGANTMAFGIAEGFPVSVLLYKLQEILGT